MTLITKVFLDDGVITAVDNQSNSNYGVISKVRKLYTFLDGQGSLAISGLLSKDEFDLLLFFRNLCKEVKSPDELKSKSQDFIVKNESKGLKGEDVLLLVTLVQDGCLDTYAIKKHKNDVRVIERWCPLRKVYPSNMGFTVSRTLGVEPKDFKEAFNSLHLEQSVVFQTNYFVREYKALTSHQLYLILFKVLYEMYDGEVSDLSNLDEDAWQVVLTDFYRQIRVINNNRRVFSSPRTVFSRIGHCEHIYLQTRQGGTWLLNTLSDTEFLGRLKLIIKLNEARNSKTDIIKKQLQKEIAKHAYNLSKSVFEIISTELLPTYSNNTPIRRMLFDLIDAYNDDS